MEDKEEMDQRNKMEQKQAPSEEFVQINYERIPHERDTDDVITDG